MIIANSLIAGKIVKGNIQQHSVSPINGAEIAEINSLDDSQMVVVFEAAQKNEKLDIKKNVDELIKLADFIQLNHDKFLDHIMKDAGFTLKDSEDLVNGTIEFCRDYNKHLEEIGSQELKTSFSFKGTSHERISYTSDPFGLIVATTPRNTPLITELTIIVHAIWSGNSLVLRPSPGVAGTVSLLIEGMLESFDEKTLSRLNVVYGDARKFIEIGMNYADIIHYVGSSKYLENTLISGIKNGVRVLVDGDGCSLVIVDKNVNVKETVKACYEGFIRCNTQICISIRAIVIHESIYNEFKTYFLELIKNTKVDFPNRQTQPDMGPLFSEAQVNGIIEVGKKYDLIAGDLKPMEHGLNYIKPVVLELQLDNLNFLEESVFGPIVGLASFNNNDWKKWLTENPINLTDALFSNNQDFIAEFLRTSNSPRRVINIDPTIESVFEPWGAFLPSGWNDVSYWFHKYRNFYQLITK